MSENHSPLLATLQQQAIPSPNDGALAKLFLDNFFSGFGSAARGADASVLTLIAHRRPYAIDETVPSPKNGFQHWRRRPRPQVDIGASINSRGASRNHWIVASTPSTQRQLDGVAMWSTSFMRQLVQLISDHPDVISFDENGILCIPSPPDLEKLLPNYYRTAKLASFQRQLNNFGYHRVGWTPSRGSTQQPQGLKYHKVVGEATTRTESLLELRPLSRRKRERAPAAPAAPRRRHARAEPLKRARTESDANAAMLLLSCMRREDSLPALGAPVAV